MKWLLAATLATCAQAQVPPPARIATLATQATARTGAKGLAIAVVANGRLVSAQAFGARNATGEPLTPDTIMYGASLTKAVVGYTVAMLAREGRVSLDRPIAAMLPRSIPDYGNLDAYGNWGDLAGDDRWRAITPRHVLTHATGFANFAFLEPDGRLRFHADPGTRYGYSGEGMMLLQFGLERGLGLDLQREVQARVFAPAGAVRTSLIWRPDFAANLADGWNAEGRPEPHDARSRARAAGSMDTTIADMGRIAAFMVRGGGRPLAGWSRGTLPITTARQFPTLQPDAPVAERPDAAAALGVIAFTGPQGRGWYKGGHNDTTGNIMVCVEKGRRCVVILANDVRAEPAFPGLVRALLGETGVPWRWEYGSTG
jgi:CubicO group peptidase (beta-lactamase class C family)